MTVGRIGSISLDCAEPAPLAEFWATVTGGEIAFRSDEFIAVRLPNGTFLATVRVPDHRPPVWPDGDTPKQFHLDVAVTDLDVAEDLTVAAGATKAEHQPAPGRYRVLVDPAGHPFCLSNQIPE